MPTKREAEIKCVGVSGREGARVNLKICLHKIHQKYLTFQHRTQPPTYPDTKRAREQKRMSITKINRHQTQCELNKHTWEKSKYIASGRHMIRFRKKLVQQHPQRKRTYIETNTLQIRMSI